MTEHSSPARSRYYIVSPDMAHDPSDCVFVNEDEALIDGVRAGAHEHLVPGYPAPIRLGVPSLRQKPKLVIGAERDELLDIYGFGMRFVSTRAKELLESLDPEAFEFVECDAVDGDGLALDPYWLMAVIRLVDTFDEERSNFIRYRDENPEDPEASSNPAIVKLNDIWMPEDFPGEVRAFHFAKYRTYFIADGTIADSWKKNNFTGAVFTPLQPPTEEELQGQSSFVNRPYWSEKGRT